MVDIVPMSFYVYFDVWVTGNVNLIIAIDRASRNHTHYTNIERPVGMPFATPTHTHAHNKIARENGNQCAIICLPLTYYAYANDKLLTIKSYGSLSGGSIDTILAIRPIVLLSFSLSFFLVLHSLRPFSSLVGKSFCHFGYIVRTVSVPGVLNLVSVIAFNNTYRLTIRYI